MEIRLFNRDEDYVHICNWWLARGWNRIPLVSLPKTGLIIDGICSCFLYTTDSDIMILAFPLSNPECSDELRSKGLDLMLEKAKNIAIECGIRLLVTKANNKSLIERYKNLDFKIIDTDVPTLVCELE